MANILVAILFIVMIINCGCSKYGETEGTVLNKRTKKPEVGAIVTIKGTTLASITNKGGKFTIKEIPPGIQKIVANKEGFMSPGEAELVIEKGKTVKSPDLFVIPRPDVIGKWFTEENGIRLNMEFFKDNTYTMQLFGNMAGKWLALDDGRIKLESTMWGSTQTIMGKLEGENLVLEMGGGKIVYHKEK